jgi:HlyD family secretion protein
MGGFPGGGNGGGRRRAETEGPKSGTVYLVQKEKTATGGERTVLQAVNVKLGISDGTSTELVEGLKESDVIAIGTATVVAAAPETRNPLNPFSNRPRR